MADPSLFPFLDLLIAKIGALPACAAPVAVFDGYPGASLPDTFVSIGGTIVPLQEGKQSFAQLGAMAMWETYMVDVGIRAWAGGDAGDGSVTFPQTGDTQRTTRQTATGIFNAIFEAVRADPNFAVANNGTPLVLYCRIDDVAVTQGPADPAAPGRMTEILFKIYVKNRISAT